jgi:filamentous hemagglutinin family protein
MAKLFSFIFLLFFTFSLQAQNLVSLNKNGKVSKYMCMEKVSYQNINGKVNLSINITDYNILLELNNIDEKLFVCGSNLNSKDFKIVIIDNKKNITYTSNSNIQVLLKCNKSKDTFTVNFSGLVKNRSSKINVTSELYVKPTPRKILKTN